MSKYRYHTNKWDGEPIFVFGSNLAGRHGAGAAKYAIRHCGAVYGRGEGFQGRAYALPTKDKNIQPMPISAIATHVKTFLANAEVYQDRVFFVTQIGCGLAGYSKEDIAPLFIGAPTNCIFPIEWKDILEENSAT